MRMGCINNDKKASQESIEKYFPYFLSVGSERFVESLTTGGTFVESLGIKGKRGLFLLLKISEKFVKSFRYMIPTPCMVNACFRPKYISLAWL